MKINIRDKSDFAIGTLMDLFKSERIQEMFQSLGDEVQARLRKHETPELNIHDNGNEFETVDLFIRKKGGAI